MPKSSPWGTATTFTEKKNPKEWKKLLNVIIEQDLWDPELHKPNDIHQLYSDFHKFDSNCFRKTVKIIRNRKESEYIFLSLSVLVLLLRLLLLLVVANPSNPIIIISNTHLISQRRNIGRIEYDPPYNSSSCSE